MSTKDDANWLADFYQKVAGGGQIQWRANSTREWRDMSIGPFLEERLDRNSWRIKPKPREWYIFVPNNPAHECRFHGWNDVPREDGIVVKAIEVIE